MLQMEYQNSYNHNYLKLKAKWEQGGKMRYQYRILTLRNPQGLLRTDTYSEDGESGLRYDISSKQSLDKYFLKGRITTPWMEELEAALKEALWSMEQYLLDYRNLILRPDCIFQDMESEKIQFLYYPYYAEEESPDMEAFLSFLLDHTEENESRLLEIFYDIYAEWETLREEFTAETFLLLWEKGKQGNQEKKTETEIWEEELVQEAGEECGETEKRMDLGEFFFGRHRKKQKEEESFTESPAPPDEEEMGKTTYLEVKPEKEERKLFGNGRQNRRVISLDKLPLIIGKKGGMADVILADGSVSRMHARITEESEKIYLEDLNTTNGTYKNGIRLKPYERVELWKEDEIKLGKLEFTYR